MVAGTSNEIKTLLYEYTCPICGQVHSFKYKLFESEIKEFLACEKTKALSPTNFTNTIFQLKVEDSNNTYIVDCHIAVPKFTM